MKAGTILILILITFSIGCVTTGQKVESTEPMVVRIPASTPTYQKNAPLSIEESTCLDVLETTFEQSSYEAYGGRTLYKPLIPIKGTVKSNCKYPVQGGVQLQVYDQNNNLVGYGEKQIQDVVTFSIKPGQTKIFSMSFDSRSIPENDVRDPNPDRTVNYIVTSFVTRIVGANEASTWE